jgi:hypothetical protein
VKDQIKKYGIVGIFLLIGYFFASYHVIFLNKKVNILEKSYLTYEYTFFNLTDKDPEDVFQIDNLREDGIGDLMVDLGILEESEKLMLEAEYGDSSY